MYITELEHEIAKEYQDGKSISQLSREYPISYGRIQKVLRELNIAIRGGRKKKILTPEQLIILKQKYEDGEELKLLGEYFKMDKNTIKRIVEENKFTRRNRNRVNKRIKSDYFSNIDSSEKAYWLGFLFTDGSVDHHGTTGRVRLQLQATDREILEKYKECLGLDCKIIDDIRTNSHCCSVEFTDQQIYEDLGDYGIIPNKTYKTTHIPYKQIPKEYWTDYARGLFDGDGGLTYSNNMSDVTLGFTAYHESVVQDFQTLIDTLINKDEHNKIFFTSAWHVQWRGRLQVIKILDKLYENSTIHLNRKYQKYLTLLN